MLVPSIFGTNLFGDMDRLFDFPDRCSAPAPAPRHVGLMKTDIRETDTDFEIEMDLPGYEKDEVTAEIKDGYLTVTAEKNDEKNDEDKKKSYIHRERFYGKTSRSFYVGKHIHESDIGATFKNGTLMLTVPKEKPEPDVNERHLVTIS